MDFYSIMNYDIVINQPTCSYHVEIPLTVGQIPALCLCPHFFYVSLQFQYLGVGHSTLFLCSLTKRGGEGGLTNLDLVVRFDCSVQNGFTFVPKK